MTEVNNTMDSCPNCGIELEKITLDRDYDTQIETDIYELEHPVRSKISKIMWPYLEHLADAWDEDADLQHSAKQERLAIIFAFLYVVLWLPLCFFISDITGESVYSWILLIFIALVPLYTVTVWIVVKNDRRNIHLKDKILRSLHGALNKLAFNLLVVGLLIYLIIQFNNYD